MATNIVCQSKSHRQSQGLGQGSAFGFLKGAAQGLNVGDTKHGACAQLTRLSDLLNSFHLTSGSEKPDA